jgi:DnaK suppressor protein
MLKYPYLILHVSILIKLFSVTTMNKKDLNNFKEVLTKTKEELETSLNSFATKDPKLEGDWDSKFPAFARDPNVNLEEEADEVEEYITRLPVEHSYELRIQAINKALEKIKKGTYGTCDGCEKQISVKRLEAYPEAGLCMDCQNK